MKLGLFQEQSLKLKMTQELQQAISLLQYSTTDLQSYLEELTLENPLIEIKETYIPPYHPTSSNSDKQSYIENTFQEKTSLRDYLRTQLLDFSFERKEKACLELLIHALDSNGYLKDDLTDLAKVLDVREDLMESKLYFLQSLDPAGVGARSLQECILLQLRRLPIRNSVAETIIADHFRAFAEKSWKDLSKKLEIKTSDIQEIHELIKKLEPRPGLKYEDEDASYVAPDIFVKKINDQFHILYNDELLPQLIVHSPLQPDSSNRQDTEAKDYYSKKLTQGRWLQRAIEQRKETMIRVMGVIIEKQLDFFLHGKSHIKPLTLKEIADILEIHESTVSRTVKDKFVQTPHGLVKMKTFFSSKLDEENGEVSAAAVKVKLQDIVDAENKKKPLSDQKIADRLEVDYDIRISRRTVTKYREQLKIPASVIRKQY